MMHPVASLFESPFKRLPSYLVTATGTQPVHVEGDLIVRAHLQLEKHGLSRLFSLKR